MPLYSNRWFATFLHTVPAETTEREVDALTRWLPRREFPSILDLACGTGRHAGRLARAGYQVTGLEADGSLLAGAERAQPGNPAYVVGDMGDLEAVPGHPFDAVVNLWQSFGWLDPVGNDGVLRQIHAVLRPGGRLLLDLYHHGFFEAHQGTRTVTRSSQRIEETKRIREGRLTVELRYPGGEVDRFDWEVFTPEELERRAGAIGFALVRCVTGFSDGVPASPARPRFQALFERR